MAKLVKGTVLIAVSSATFRAADGKLVTVRKGHTTIRVGHPYLRGREHLFKPQDITFDVGVQA